MTDWLTPPSDEIMAPNHRLNIQVTEKEEKKDDAFFLSFFQLDVDVARTHACTLTSLGLVVVVVVVGKHHQHHHQQ